MSTLPATAAIGAATLRWPSRHAFLIGCGEVLSRAFNLLLLVFVSRRFGVRGLGVFALAQGISLYLLQGIDLGLRHIGARLIAEDETQITAIVIAVQRKRILLAGVMMLAGYAYGRFGPVPQDARSMVSLYALSILGYALSLDWMAWGLRCFTWLSAWRAAVSASVCAGSMFAIEILSAPLTAIAVANGIAYLFAAAMLWLLWARPLILAQPITAQRITAQPAPKLRSQTHWSSVAALGFALLANQALGSADLLMLGGMRGSREAGLYSAAYRLLLLVTVVYYFATQALYPQLAALPAHRRNIGTLWPSLWRLSIAGLAITLLAELARGSVIKLLFGVSFAPAIELSGPLLFAIVPDFLASLLMTALTAWNRSRLVFTGTAIAASFNVVMNLLLIPRFGAMGSAYVTPVSYCVLFVILIGGLQRGASPYAPAPSARVAVL